MPKPGPSGATGILHGRPARQKQPCQRWSEGEEGSSGSSGFLISRRTSPGDFYFDVFIGSDANLDADGHEIGSLWAAEIAAKRTAGELARAQLLKLQDAAPESIWVEVKNEHRQHVLTVTVSLRVEQVEPLP